MMLVVLVLLVATVATACGATTPEASFTATPVDGGAPLVVEFTDTSENEPTSWEWDFGDGDSGAQQSPSHAYEQAGTFEVTLVATNDAGSGTSETTRSITVGPGALAAVIPSTTGVSVAAGETLTLSATAIDAFENALEGATLTWATTSGVAISDVGALTASTKAGAYEDAVVVTATSGGLTVTESIDVIVEPGALDHAEIVDADEVVEVTVGAAHGYTALAFDGFGNVIDPTDVGVAWDVGDIGTTDADGGFIAGTRAGTFEDGIFAFVTQGTASAEATATVAVLPDALVAVSIAPENPVVGAGQQLRLTALPLDQYGNAIAADDVTWAADPRAGVLGLGGLLDASASTAVFAEGVKVTVLKDGVTRSFISSLEVTHGALDSFSIAVASDVLAIGGQTTLEVVASDAFGNPVPTSGVRWAVAGETHSVAADGTFTAGVRAGTFAVTGTLSAGGRPKLRSRRSRSRRIRSPGSTSIPSLLSPPPGRRSRSRLSRSTSTATPSTASLRCGLRPPT
jgi:PKD repeat protein